MESAQRPPIRRRLRLLTAVAAVAGTLFVPFIRANPAADIPDAGIALVTVSVGAALVTLAAARLGLVWADRAGLPMPLLHAWEARRAPEPGSIEAAVLPAVLGGVAGLVAGVVGNALGVPDNPGSLAVRVATTPFAAVVPEVFVHLCVMSGLALATKRPWIAVLISSVVFVALFHRVPPGSSAAVVAFLVNLNFGLATLTGWAYARRGFASAILAHASAHLMVLAIN